MKPFRFKKTTKAQSEQVVQFRPYSGRIDPIVNNLDTWGISIQIVKYF